MTWINRQRGRLSHCINNQDNCNLIHHHGNEFSLYIASDLPLSLPGHKTVPITFNQTKTSLKNCNEKTIQHRRIMSRRRYSETDHTRSSRSLRLTSIQKAIILLKIIILDVV